MGNALRRLINALQKLRGALIPPERKLSKEAVISLMIHAGFQFGASMSGIFLNLYLWRLTHSLTVNGIYNMVALGMTAVAFIIGGKWTKQWDRVFTIRIGIALLVVFYLTAVIIQEALVDYFVLFAFFQGLAGGLYWIGYLTLMYDVCTEQNRMRYISLNLIFFTAAGLVGPALAGAIIGANDGLKGYMITFAVAFAVFFATVLLSLRIRPYRTHHRKYYLRLMLPLIKKNKRLQKALWAYFILGLQQGILLFLPNILLYQVIPREEVIGYLGVLFSAISVAASYLMSIQSRENKEMKYVMIASVGITVGALLLTFGLSLWSVVGFMALYALFVPFQGNSMTSYFFRLIGKLPLKGQLRIESVVIRDTFLESGRMISIFVLITFAADVQAVQLSWIIVLFSALQMLQYFLLEKDI